MTKEETKTVGEAYAFFNCDASKADIEADLPTIRAMAKTPSELELTLMEGMDEVGEDKEIREIAQEAKGFRKYALQAKLPGYSNQRTAREVGDILNTMYASSLYDGKKFVGETFWYRKGDGYVSRK